MRILATFLLPILAFSQALTQGERDRALSELHASGKLFADALTGLSAAQWNFKPDANTWSIAECAEHIALSEDLVFGVIQKVMASPAAPEKRAEVKGKDAVVLKSISDRTTRFKAPESLAPTGRWKTAAETLAHFRRSRERLMEYIRTTGDPLRVHFSPHPAVGLLDAYQWVLLTGAHTERHVSQIAEVKANPAYPK